MEMSLKEQLKELAGRSRGTLGSHQEAESLGGGCGLYVSTF